MEQKTQITEASFTLHGHSLQSRFSLRRFRPTDTHFADMERSFPNTEGEGGFLMRLDGGPPLLNFDKEPAFFCIIFSRSFCKDAGDIPIPSTREACNCIAHNWALRESRVRSHGKRLLDVFETWHFFRGRAPFKALQHWSCVPLGT